MTRSEPYLTSARRRVGHHQPATGIFRRVPLTGTAATDSTRPNRPGYFALQVRALARPSPRGQSTGGGGGVVRTGASGIGATHPLVRLGWEGIAGWGNAGSGLRRSGPLGQTRPATPHGPPIDPTGSTPTADRLRGVPLATGADEIERRPSTLHAPIPAPGATASPADADAAAAGPTLQGELARVRRRQRSPVGRLHRRWQGRRHRRAWTAVVLGVPLTILIVLGLTVGPVVLEGTRAYQKVFVDPVPRDTSPLLPGVNADGTPTLIGNGGVGDTVAAVAAPLPEWNGTEPLLMLLIGVDQRTEDESRSDTMILVWVDPVAKEAAMLPLPRDLKVIVPGYGIHKINAAYAIGEARGVEGGGPALTVQTIEANFGVRINHFAQVNFDGFVGVVDLLGGVTLDVPYPIKDNAYPAPNLRYTRVYFPAGWQHLDGERALQYARTRHADNDAQRSIRQQQVLLALREQASIGELIPQAASLLAALGDSVRTDLDLDQAIKLARLASEIPIESIDQYTLLNTVTEEDPAGIYYLVPDWDAVGEVMTQFTRSLVTPPAAALDYVDYDLPIRVENGTLNAGLAQRVADVLAANGFTDVTFAPNAYPGLHPESTFVDTSGNVTTAGLVAALIGFSPDIIDEQYTGPPLDPATGASPGSPAASRATEDGGSPRAGAATGSPDDPSGIGLGDPGSDPSAPSDTGGVWTEPTPEVAFTTAPRRAETSGEIVIVLGDDTADPAWYVETEGGG